MTATKVTAPALVAQPTLTSPYDRVESVPLHGEQVQHWSTASYGPSPTGYIAAIASTSGLDVPDGALTLTIHTPSKPKGSDIIGGARRIDLVLTDAQAERLAYVILAGLKRAREKAALPHDSMASYVGAAERLASDVEAAEA